MISKKRANEVLEELKALKTWTSWSQRWAKH
jgi:hypothetical protein